MKNAGAKLLDQPVVQDKKIITSRSPEDLPFFCQAIAKELNLPIELKYET
jgi:protease I